MKCPYCNGFKGNSKVRGYTVREQLDRHIEITHAVQPAAATSDRAAGKPWWSHQAG